MCFGVINLAVEMKNLSVYLVLILILLSISCVRESIKAPENSLIHKNWFPLNPGEISTWRVYDTIFTSTDSLIFEYLLKDSVLEPEYEAGEQAIWHVEISRADTQAGSVFSPVFRQTRFIHQSYAAEQTGNVKMLILPLPPVSGHRWNACRLQAECLELRRVLSSDTTVSGFRECAFVLTQNESTAIESHYGFEMFEPDKGKVLSFKKDMEYTITGSEPVLVQGRSVYKQKE